MFSLAGEGGIQGYRRRQDDGEQIERDMMGVAAGDQRQMEQGVRGQEAGACHRRRPVARAPCPRGEREAGDEKCKLMS